MRRSWSLRRLPRAAVAGPNPTTQSDRSHLGIVWSALGASTLAVVVGVALGRPPLNLYDVSFSLDWGSDVVHGLVPDVRVSGASTPHPLSFVSGAVAVLFGSSALDVMRELLFASTGVAAVALYRIGAVASSRAVGVVAVVVLFCSEPFLFATLGQATPSDLPGLAAVLAALACELAQPKRAVAPLELFVRRLPRLLLALLALSVLSFAVIGAARLPLQERYALPTTVLLAVFFGYLVAGWQTMPPSRLRQVWMLTAVTAGGFVIAAT